jgi:hypothetical protein
VNKIVYNKPKTNTNSIPESIKNVETHEIISDSKEILEYFNKYFCEIGEKLASSIPHTNNEYNTEHENNSSNCYFYKTNKTEVLNVISELNSDASSGHDGISCKLYKYCKNELCQPIAQLVNLCLKEGIFPDILKIGKVTAIHKSGDKTNPLNYRPITVLPILSKILEKIILSRLNSYLTSINFISPAQYGFCTASSTEAACITLLNDIQKGLDAKKNIQVALMFIDLSKAFDTVPHNILLSKMLKLGIKNKNLLLFESYLKHRIQFMKNNNLCSENRVVICGVPQGAILSPTLFNIFINDIASLPLRGRIILYADDICLKYEGCNATDMVKFMEKDLVILDNWFKANKLSLNIKKTKFMIISPKHIKNDNIELPQLNNMKIERVQEYKYLGLIIDSNLKWSTHIDQIKSKILPIIGILKRIKYTVPTSTKLRIYFSFVQSHLNYLNVIWGSAANIYLSNLKVLQNYALKNIYKLNFREPTLNVYRIANLPNLNTLRLINLAKFLYKLQNGMIKSDLSLTLNKEIHRYSTRISNAIRIDYARTNFGKFAVLREGIHLYNSIPNYIKEIPNFNSFKQNVRLYFLSKQLGQ